MKLQQSSYTAGPDIIWYMSECGPQKTMKGMYLQTKAILKTSSVMSALEFYDIKTLIKIYGVFGYLEKLNEIKQLHREKTIKLTTSNYGLLVQTIEDTTGRVTQ